VNNDVTSALDSVMSPILLVIEIAVSSGTLVWARVALGHDGVPVGCGGCEVAKESREVEVEGVKL
jgi:hypothetical protein